MKTSTRSTPLRRLALVLTLAAATGPALEAAPTPEVTRIREQLRFRALHEADPEKRALLLQMLETGLADDLAGLAAPAPPAPPPPAPPAKATPDLGRIARTADQFVRRTRHDPRIRRTRIFRKRDTPEGLWFVAYALKGKADSGKSGGFLVQVDSVDWSATAVPAKR